MLAAATAWGDAENAEKHLKVGAAHDKGDLATAPEPLQPRADEVAVAAGHFDMGSEGGSAEEKPVHKVNVAAFYLDRTEVTVAAYRQCVQAGKCQAHDTVNWEGYSQADAKKWSRFCTWGKADRDTHPINCVDWDQATAYCAWKGKRLPTEEEWEYAARGTDGRKYPWGNTPEPGPTLLNACGAECAAMWLEKFGQARRTMYQGSDGWPETAPVGSFHKGKSPFGAEDMAGNVWEWTASGYCTYPDTQCSASRRVVRGGSWYDDGPSFMRAASRVAGSPSYRNMFVGFRCARSVLK
jgi:formylglycine-generating enzyme required for sulfatase activity